MRKEDLKDWTRDRLKDEIVNLSEKNFNLEWRIKQFGESEGRLKCENKALKDENAALKQRIKDMEDVCDRSYSSDYEDLPFGDDERDKLIAKLQDQHQQDCIRYNDMRTAYLVTLDELARLREQFGIGR